MFGNEGIVPAFPYLQRDRAGNQLRALFSLPRQKETTSYNCIARAERDGTRAETRFSLFSKRTSPFKSVGASVQSTAGSRGVRISLSNAG